MANHSSETMDILEEMLKSEDCNEPGKLIIKNEYSDTENYVIEETGVKYEPFECVKCELYIKDELKSGEEGDRCEPASKAEDCNSSGGNGSSRRKTEVKKFASKEEQLHCCPNCPFSSDWKWNLQRHKLTHSDLDRQSSVEEQKFKCHYCDYKTKQKPNLNRHISLIHEREKATVYACQQCTYKTVQARNLQSHLRSHGEKVFPHKCPGCGKGFRERTALDHHLLRKHDSLRHLIASRIYDCKFCAYRSTMLTELKRHIRVKHDRSNAEKFQCHNCNFFTVHKESLTRHLAVHVNLKPHQCPSCRKGFNRKDSLESHMVHKHKDDALLLKNITRKIHQCTSCDFKTVRKSCLGRHIEANHK